MTKKNNKNNKFKYQSRNKISMSHQQNQKYIIDYLKNLISII